MPTGPTKTKETTNKRLQQLGEQGGAKLAAELAEKIEAAGDNAERLATVLREVNDIIDELGDGFSDVEITVFNMAETLKSITEEITHNLVTVRKVQGAFGKLGSIASQLTGYLRGENELTIQQIKHLQKKASISEELLNTEAALNNIKEAIGSGRYGERELPALLATKKALEDRAEIFKSINEISEKALGTAIHVQKVMGLTGVILKGVSGILGKIGLSSSIFAEHMESIQETMRKTAQEGGSRLQVLMSALPEMAEGFGEALTDPLAIIGMIWSKFQELDKASMDLIHSTGQNKAVQAALNTELATGVEVLGQMASLAKETGMVMSGFFTADEVALLVEAKSLLGLSAEQANRLGMYSKVAKTTSEDYTESIIQGVNAYNATNKSIVAGGEVLQEVLKTSTGIALSLGGNPIKLAKAAASAKQLGLELSKVDAIASSLMDFESSIQNELEAQLITGRSIYLGKAREYALTNNYAGLAQELRKYGVDAYEFAGMNRLAQESLAKALGMTRDELGKMAEQELITAGATTEALAAARGMTKADYERVSATEGLETALNKLAEPLASILTHLTPVFNAFAKFISWMGPFALPALLAIGAGLKYFSSTFMVAGKSSEIASKGIAGAMRTLAGVAPMAASAGATLGVFAGFVGVITAAVIGLGFALRIAAPGIRAIGEVIRSAFSGIVDMIQAVASGFKTIFSDVTMETVGVMLSLGTALLTVAAGLGAIGATGLLALPALLAMKNLNITIGDRQATGVELNTVGPKPTSGKITSAETKTSLGSTGSESAITVTQFYKKIDELISAVREGRDMDIYLDSDRVGKTMVLSAVKSS